MTKKLRLNDKIKTGLFTTIIASIAFAPQGRAESDDAVDHLLNKLQQKGVLTSDEANELKAEEAADETNQPPPPPPSVWKIATTFKSIQLFGDVRLRYEYRGADNNVPSPGTYYRERFRYSLRFGIRGDLVDNFYYGVRLETGSWSRSPWDTFGNNGTAGSVSPSDKSSSGINVGQLYLGWRPENWLQLTAGRMPQPLYTTPMVWSPNINPEGFFEKLSFDAGDANVFAGFAQFDYQDPTEAVGIPSSDLFVLAWQLGVKGNIGKDWSYEIAPVLYNYTGTGFGASSASSGLGQTFVGQGNASGQNVGVPGGVAGNVTAYNEVGVNDLLVLEIPEELNYQLEDTFLGPLQLRAFGDFAINLDGHARARNAYNVNPAAFPGLSGPVYGQDKAFQVGFGVGSGGLIYGPSQGVVYGSTSRKNSWEARVYWQHVEQYSLDPNLLDPDFFEAAANLQGVYMAFAYSVTDAIILTTRYGYATRIDTRLGTATSGLDITSINPINNYNVLQFDVAWRF
jgi:hypothetical protein